MKTLSKVLLIGLLSFALVACGKETETTPVEETPTEVQESTETGSKDIHVYTRDASSGTREAFENIVGFDKELTDLAVETSSNGDMATKVGKDTSSIGYVSLTTDFDANNLKAIPYEGVEANIENTVSDAYKLNRPFNLVTRAKGDFESTEKEELVAAFVDFLMNSTEGREIVLSQGGIVDVAGGKAWDELKANHPILEKDNSAITVYTGGSTSVEKTLKAAIELFQPMAGGFEINMNHTGSGDGFKRALGSEKDGPNKIDIGFASRDFKDTEDVAEAMLSGSYCKDAVVVVVEMSNPIENFTKEQLQSIFKGEITDWALIK